MLPLTEYFRTVPGAISGEDRDRLLGACAAGSMSATGRAVPRAFRKASRRGLPPRLHDIRDRVVEIALREYAELPVAEASWEPGRVEAQLTRSGDGEFYRPHFDNGRGTHPRIGLRAVTYIVYLGERAYGGGALRLHPTRPMPRHIGGHRILVGRKVPGEPVEVEPEDGTLVVFPSWVLHEVSPVTLPGDPWKGGRFTLNGWVGRTRNF